MQTVLTGVTDILGVPFRVALIPATNLNRPGQPHPGQPAWAQNRKLDGGKYTTSTVHETANTSRGANAEMHRQFVFSGGGAEGVSFHAVVDDKEIIQLLPLDEVAWQAGDGARGPGNSTSVATETCINSDGNWSKTLDNLAKWQAYLAFKGGLLPAEIVQHNHWSGKDCPHVIRATPGGWASLLTNISRNVAILQQGEPLYVPPSTHPVMGKFKVKYQSKPDALELWGLPVTDARQEKLSDGNTYLVQWFERARMELHGDNVMLGLVGSELLAKD